MKKSFIFIFVLILSGLVAGYMAMQERDKKLSQITSYDDCVAAGFPSLESYPPRCVTSDGRSFTQYIGNELEYKDEIIVEHPRPNQQITNPLDIHGRVRGRWLFEATFSGELFDANDEPLGTAVLKAEGEWMTIDLVPFKGVMTFRKPQTATGTLKIINANPSGLPENEYVLMIPVRFFAE